mmetsp:Transcript_44284/g.94261  ORF Transcript_44284/g.94261 Transcript_44284/m.94261 type:complete len:447 (-) Transcript_44284:355-1695(-)
MDILHEFLLRRELLQRSAELDQSMAVGPTHPRREESHTRSPNESRRLLRCVYEIICMHYSHNVLELGCPILSRRAIPVEMLRLFQDANVAILLRNQPDQVSHAVERVLQNLLPRRVPPDIQLLARPPHVRRVPQPVPDVLLLILRRLEPPRAVSPVHSNLILGPLYPREDYRDGPPRLATAGREVGRPQEGVHGRARHPGEGTGGDDPYVLRLVGDVSVGHDRLPRDDGTGLRNRGEGLVERRQGDGEGAHGGRRSSRSRQLFRALGGGGGGAEVAQVVTRRIPRLQQLVYLTFRFGQVEGHVVRPLLQLLLPRLESIEAERGRDFFRVRAAAARAVRLRRCFVSAALAGRAAPPAVQELLPPLQYLLPLSPSLVHQPLIRRSRRGEHHGIRLPDLLERALPILPHPDLSLFDVFLDLLRHGVEGRGGGLVVLVDVGEYCLARFGR